ncbi:MAG: phosphohistidine phosphatase SixA [Terriglobia bacterium]
MTSGKSTNTHHNADGHYEIYLMRHGIAEDRDPEGSSDDAKRPLTPEGEVKVRAIARGLDRIGAKWDWIITSPLKRAVETADALTDELGSSAPRDLCEALTPDDGSRQKVTAFLAQHPGRSRILLVGHEPSLSDLASELIGAGREACLTFKKGGCCLVSFDQFPSAKAPGALSWWLTPRLLRKIGA